jgi:ergothioneine biosynthesis protein EgtB
MQSLPHQWTISVPAAFSPKAERGERTLRQRFAAVRRRSEELARPLSPEDCQVQAVVDVSPTKWHLAHTTWFFEQFVLGVYSRAYVPFDRRFAALFNSYYESVGDVFPRAQRGMITRPTLAGVLRYREHVTAAVGELLDDLAAGRLPLSDDERAQAAARVELGLQHEQQHQELILTDVLYNFAANPHRPGYSAPMPCARACSDAPASSAAVASPAWTSVAGGVVEIGAAEDGFAFDNERPRHRVFVDGFALATRLVTNREYAAFIAAGGYGRPELWLSDGWARVQREGWRAPLYWEPDGRVMTLHGLVPLDPERPVCHVSYFEAQAYAAYAGCRLPSEAEWELAARGIPPSDAPEGGALLPAAAAKCAESPDAPQQLFGHVWQWTQSAYLPYPGFRPLEGSAAGLGEYNGKFMCGQMVLKGSSCVTPPGHARGSYRNFFPPEARWQFTGIRLATTL